MIELADSFWKLLLPGIRVTIPLTAISFTCGLIIALLVALVQVAKIPVARQAARFYVWIIRGTPMIVQLFVVYFGLPSIGIRLAAFPSAVIVFSLSVGAYCSETIRAAIESIPRGQMEACYCVGMTFWQGMTRVVIPQAMRAAFRRMKNKVIAVICIGDYGDSRGIALLKGYLDRNTHTIDRETFYEALSAIRRLGGEINDIQDPFHDFTNKVPKKKDEKK